MQAIYPLNRHHFLNNLAEFAESVLFPYSMSESKHYLSKEEQLTLVIVGHVDHGKSTLIGRLVYEMGCLPDGKYEAIHASCKRRGVPFEWSFLMDALQSERSQGITIDMTQLWLRTPERDYAIIDAPGHHEFLKNMMTGAAQSDAAILMIDAEEGLREQSRRHAYLLYLLGVKRVIVLVNKMDVVGYEQHRFTCISEEITSYLHGINLSPVAIIPASAYHGDMLVHRGEAMGWYQGLTLKETLQDCPHTAYRTDQPLRLPVQDVYKFDHRRIIAGTIDTGELHVGDTILISPTNYTATVASIEHWTSKDAGDSLAAQHAIAGQAIGITLEDARFIERGHTISHVEDAPLMVNRFSSHLFWLGHMPLTLGESYSLRINTASYLAELIAIDHIIDTQSLQHHEGHTRVERHQVARVTWKLRGLAAIDAHSDLAQGGRYAIMQDYRINGGGIILADGLQNQRTSPQSVMSRHLFTEDMLVSRDSRSQRNGHKGGVLWFTGLSGSGKSTLARQVQQSLFAKGYQVYVLDGDNIRQGLNADLGFDAADRSENIRRIGEVAALFADAGFIVITAFISPYSEDRRRARAVASECFHIVHIEAELATCEARDAKGLYRKARAGEIDDFTGVSAPYEMPRHAELVVRTDEASVEVCSTQIIDYVQQHFGVM